jgi:pimeloyl-ACP methyl ester carboxylesterase
MAPALVFAPWVPFSNLRMEWQNPLLHQVFEQLAQELTLVHYDGRGTGHSQRDVTDVSLEAMVSDLEAVIGRTGLTQVGLLGEYNSCPHAIAYAARHPERVSRMVPRRDHAPARAVPLPDVRLPRRRAVAR